jgi:ABC-type transport system substrate-binding protein
VSAGFPVREAGWLLQDVELERFFYRPQVARALLLDTGVELPIAVSIMVGDFRQAYLDHAGLMADEMEAVGFEPTIEVVSRRQFGDDVWLGGNYQMFAGPIAPISSPNGYLLPVLHSQGVWNTTEHKDDVLDGLIVVQAQESDAELRTELAREIQLRMFEKAYRFMPATRMSIWTWWPRVRGFHPNFAGFGYDHWSRVSVGE